MTTLQTRLAQADKPSRELLWEAWQDIMMPELCGDDENSQRSLYIHQCRYLQLLDAEAWTSAVELLVPPEYAATVITFTDGRGRAILWQGGFLDAHSNAATGEIGNHPALALAIACLKARRL